MSALAWITLAWLHVKAAEYFFPHHFLLAVPAIAVGVGLGVSTVWDERRRAAVVALILLVPVWIYTLVPQLRLLRVISAGA